MIKLDGVLEEIADRVRETLQSMDENYLISITGKPGRGKSGCAITLAKLIDPDFTADNIVFSSEEMLELLNTENLKPGSVIIYDEAGVGRSAQESQTKLNRSVNKVVQTFRHLRLCVMYTTPHQGYIIKNDRILLHANITVQRKDLKRKIAFVKWYYLDFNPIANNDQGKIFRQFPRIVREGRTYKIKELIIKHPPAKIWKAYKVREQKFKQEVRDDALDMIKDSKKPQVKQKAQLTQDEIKKYVKVLEKDPKKYYGRTGKLSLEKLEYTFEVGQPKAKQIRAAAELGGIYDLQT